MAHAPPGPKRGAWSLGRKNVVSRERFVEGGIRPPQLLLDGLRPPDPARISGALMFQVTR